MTSKRRDKFEIIGEILSIAEDKVGKTALIYGANLNTKRVNKYLKLLLKKGFIEEIAEKNTKYKTTENGMKFLKNYHKLKEEFEKPHIID